MTPLLGWVFLITSGIVDVAWAASMKKADGFRDLVWSAISLVLLAVFVVLLTKALTVLPVGNAYAVWTGIGAAGTVLVGMVLFGEPVSVARFAFIALIVAGIVGLNLSNV